MMCCCHGALLLLLWVPGMFSPYLRLRFDAFDPNLKGYVTVDALPALLRSVGFFGWTESELDVIVKALDVDGTGRVSWEDFEKMCIRKQCDWGSPEEVWQAFSLFDSANLKCTLSHMYEVMHQAQCPERFNEIEGVFPEEEVTFDQFRSAMNEVHGTARRATKL